MFEARMACTDWANEGGALKFNIYVMDRKKGVAEDPMLLGIGGTFEKDEWYRVTTEATERVNRKKYQYDLYPSRDPSRKFSHVGKIKIRSCSLEKNTSQYLGKSYSATDGQKFTDKPSYKENKVVKVFRYYSSP